MFDFFRKIQTLPAAEKLPVVLRVPPRAEEDLVTGLSIKVGALIDAPLCPKGLVLMCGEIGRQSRDVQSWADRMGAVLMVVEEENLSIEWIRNYAPGIDFMLVDADYMADTEDTIDFCMRVRRATPSLPIILLSSDVRSHDFTCERMMACDATLKAPLLQMALTMGVQAAYQNNEYFVKTRG
ncbi:hypothetical protein [Cypionkella sp.]|uniref:hypothetical protein n=1 Tax=Cypionkella sp. TaxID=2811411 RepID=UPI002ABA5D68|nr:hypothetical protein [Cypionkella sp.]MDZ4394204.1 hypothetical protein [Cypionkella sp.]